MDERQTLRLTAWSIGGVVGVMFFLNAVALSLTSTSPQTAPPLSEKPPPIGRPNALTLDRDNVALALSSTWPTPTKSAATMLSEESPLAHRSSSCPTGQSIERLAKKPRTKVVMRAAGSFCGRSSNGKSSRA